MPSIDLVVSPEEYFRARDALKDATLGADIQIRYLRIYNLPLSDQLVQDLLERFGPTVKKLKLEGCELTQNPLVSLLKNGQNLRELSILHPKRGRGALPSQLDTLTTAAVNENQVFENLHILHWQDVVPVQNFRLVRKAFPRLYALNLCCAFNPAKFHVGNTPPWRDLQDLSLTCKHFCSEHFRLLIRLQLRLTHCRLVNLNVDEEELSVLRFFLTECAPTLKELHLSAYKYFVPLDREIMTRHFPLAVQFPCLEFLEMDPKLFTDFSVFAGLLPRLNRLEINSQDWTGWDQQLNAPQFPGARITQAGMRLNLGAISIWSLLRVNGYFSTVARLEVAGDRIDDATFRLICQNMGSLGALSILECSDNWEPTAGVLTDEGLTGISREGLEELRNPRQGPYTRQAKRTGAANRVEAEGTIYSLASLERLTFLKLKTSQLSLSDLGVVHGIATLGELTTLDLGNNADRLTNASVTALRNMPKLTGVRMITIAGQFSAANERKLGEWRKNYETSSWFEPASDN